MSTVWLPPPATLLPGFSATAHHNHRPSLNVPSPVLVPPPPGRRSHHLAVDFMAPPRTRVPVSPVAPIKKVFRCPYEGCTQTASNNGNLKKHIACRHELRKDFHCNFAGCGKSFSKKFNLSRHTSSVHGLIPSSSSTTPSSSRRSSHARLGESVPPPKQTPWMPDEVRIAEFMSDHCLSPVNSPMRD